VSGFLERKVFEHHLVERGVVRWEHHRGRRFRQPCR